ncbi:hypothetical protein ACVBEH_14455 [Roseateles sp. GG27B]
MARHVTGGTGQMLGLRVAQQRQQLRAVGAQGVTAAEHRRGHVLLQLAGLGPARQQRLHQAHLGRQAHHFEPAGLRLLRAGQGLG